MYKKILFLILITLTISGCNYTPVYLGDENLKFNIELNSLEGDAEINKNLVEEVERINKKNELNKFFISIKSNYNREILAKDSKGIASNYTMVVNVSFLIKHKELEKDINMQERFNYKKMSNNYEQNNYEKTIKKNLSLLILQKLVIRLQNFE